MKPITQEEHRLGFVGNGYIGRPIARRLLESAESGDGSRSAGFTRRQKLSLRKGRALESRSGISPALYRKQFVADEGRRSQGLLRFPPAARFVIQFLAGFSRGDDLINLAKTNRLR